MINKTGWGLNAAETRVSVKRTSATGTKSRLPATLNVSGLLCGIGQCVYQVQHIRVGW